MLTGGGVILPKNATARLILSPQLRSPSASGFAGWPLSLLRADRCLIFTVQKVKNHRRRQVVCLGDTYLDIVSQTIS